MIEQLKNYKYSFCLQKAKYISSIIVCSIIIAVAMIIPSILATELGVYFAKMSKSVDGVYLYLQNTNKNLDIFISELKLLLMSVSVLIFVVESVNIVLSEKDFYIAKMNLGNERKGTLIEVLTKNFFNSLISFVAGVLVGGISCYLFEYFKGNAITISIQDTLTIGIVCILLSLIASYLAFLFSVDRAREIKDVN